ncbi:LOB domain-containing protein 27-like isoform X2 [Salvia divinorum]|uniref:LOB domain-containing protein 27-like isoform X2 n=1 Tax=Salvia divinorum TaxID=28513 RepID=A0ABD1GMD8_SALDI
MTVKGGSSPGCAACKYQRRKCRPACPLAPYFPADQPKIFQSVQRLFGICNVAKILDKLTTTEEKVEAIRSIIYESDMRERFPVNGCVGVLAHLQECLIAANQKLQFVNAKLQACREACMVVEHAPEQQLVEYGGGQFVINDGGDMMSAILAQMEAFGISNVVYDQEKQSYIPTSNSM